MKQAIKFAVRDAIVIVLAAVVLAAAYLFFSGAIRVHAASEYTLGYNHDTVSITCRDRNHFQYHNDDRLFCGQAIANEVHKDAQKNATGAVVVSNSVPVVVTVEPVAPVIVDYGNDTPVIEDTPETPVSDDKPTKDHCDNGAGNGDDCTPGHSSGSNQGKGGPDGDRTNQGENGNKGGNS